MNKKLLPALLLAISVAVQAQGVLRPGAIWPDNNGVHINAHGGGVLEHGGTYYWFGEHGARGASL